MADINKAWDELPADEVNFSDGSWGWGCGDGIYYISSVDHNGIETRYEMPMCINKMLDLQHKYGSDSAKMKIQAALKI